MYIIIKCEYFTNTINTSGDYVQIKVIDRWTDGQIMSENTLLSLSQKLQSSDTHSAEHYLIKVENTDFEISSVHSVIPSILIFDELICLQVKLFKVLIFSTILAKGERVVAKRMLSGSVVWK